MQFSLRRHFNLALRANRWMLYATLGFLMVTTALVLGTISTLIFTPANLETIKSFDPYGLGLASLSALLIGAYWINKAFKSAFQLLTFKDHEISERLRDLVFKKSPAARLPSLISIGGGTGLSSLLKGLKELPVELTAIVTVTDDGGSSGRLRKELQILPPGDIRNCLVALSRSESLLSRLFQYRFEEGSGFTGHSFGNIFIAAMTNVIGDFGSAVRAASNILAIRGHVIPVSCENVQLSARFDDNTEIIGETAISNAGKKIVTMKLVPQTPLANPEALNAIDKANLIVLGPGSLYTSIIPNLLVPDIADRINNSKAPVVYVCNVMTQPGETDQFTAADHVSSLLNKTPLKRIDFVIVNSRRVARHLMEKYEMQGQFWVPPTVTKIEDMGIKVATADLLSETDLVRHDPKSLATTLYSILHDSGLS